MQPGQAKIEDMRSLEIICSTLLKWQNLKPTPFKPGNTVSCDALRTSNVFQQTLECFQGRMEILHASYFPRKSPTHLKCSKRITLFITTALWWVVLQAPFVIVSGKCYSGFARFGQVMLAHLHEYMEIPCYLYNRISLIGDWQSFYCREITA